MVETPGHANGLQFQSSSHFDDTCKRFVSTAGDLCLWHHGIAWTDAVQLPHVLGHPLLLAAHPAMLSEAFNCLHGQAVHLSER